MAIAALVEEKVLLPATVEGWPQPAYLHCDARIPRRVEAQALLAPFDPLIWDRGRTERLFEFHYRIGIYTPANKRTDGYYALPFLFGDRLVARVDLKSDRQPSRLIVRQLTVENDVPAGTVERMGDELVALADWLGLEKVEK